jgi:hypothetical protein
VNKVLPSIVLLVLVAGLAVACGRGATPEPTPPPPTATSAPTSTPLPPPTSTPPPAATATSEPTNLTEQKFQFVSALGTQEEGEPMAKALMGMDGIEEAKVNEVGVTVEYDPDVITLDEIRDAIESLGYKVQEP